MATTELLKKVLYTGVGVVSTTTDRVKKSIEELTEDLNEVTEEAQTEGKKQVNVLTDEITTRREDVSARFKKIVDTVLGQFDLPNRTEAENLNAKIAELEEKLAVNKKVVRQTTRKRTAKVATPAKKVVAKKTASVKKVVAKKVAPAKKVVAKKTASVKKVVAKKVAPVKKVVAKKTAVTKDVVAGLKETIAK